MVHAGRCHQHPQHARGGLRIIAGNGQRRPHEPRGQRPRIHHLTHSPIPADGPNRPLLHALLHSLQPRNIPGEASVIRQVNKAGSFNLRNRPP